MCGAITWSKATIWSSLLNLFIFPRWAPFSFQLIIIPELVSSDNSNQKQLEALVVNQEPQSAGGRTRGWSIWQFRIAGHMDFKSILIIQFNLGRSKVNGPRECLDLQIQGLSDNPNGPNGDDETGTGISGKCLFWVLDMFDNKKTWDWSSLN